MIRKKLAIECQGKIDTTHWKGCDFMRLEKISDSQIRCTLSRNDLLERHINLGELSYGSEKARNLFREMLTKASYELDFDAEDIPLMIEAIPLSEDSVMLLITKIEDPEELDTRFSKFSPASMEDSDFDLSSYTDLSKNLFSRADEIINLFSKYSAEPENSEIIIDDIEDADNDTGKTDPSSQNTSQNFYCVYRFRTLDEVSTAARVINESYHGLNSLYKDEQHGYYYLVLHKSDHTPQEFNRVCNVLSEYSEKQKHVYAAEAYYMEHLDCIVKDKALQVMKNL